MAKTKQTKQTEGQKKIVTKYDKKMERRRLEEEKERKARKRFQIGSIVIGICVAVGLVTAIGVSFYQRSAALNHTYITVGEHEIKGIEYDYYYNTAVNNYLSIYGSYLSYMGLDTSKSFAQQQYTDTMTWKDYFDQMAVEQIKQIKAASDDAKANGFVYDDAEDYEEFQTNLLSQAETNSMSKKNYYKAAFGRYATEGRIEPYIQENLLASAYYESLVEQNKPSDQEVTDYYEEHKKEYDTVDYRSFAFDTQLEENASEEEIAAAMETVKGRAEEMQNRREKGEEFLALCQEYATEDKKADYEGEKDGSLTEGALYSSVSYYYADWLFEEERQPGDLTVVEDETNHRYYVVEFEQRVDQESSREQISDKLAQERTGDYIDGLTQVYDVIDVAGKLNYLTIEETTSAESETTSQIETTQEDHAETSSEETQTAG